MLGGQALGGTHVTHGITPPPALDCHFIEADFNIISSPPTYQHLHFPHSTGTPFSESAE